METAEINAEIDAEINAQNKIIEILKKEQEKMVQKQTCVNDFGMLFFLVTGSESNL